MNNESLPSTEMQRHFWDEWNRQNRSGKLDAFMQRQWDTALIWVQQCRKPVSILEVGCGTGWLSNLLGTYGEVTGVDLSPESVAAASARFPGIRFQAGDFQSMAFDQRFNFIVSADVIAHVPDHQAFVDRIASLLAPQGIFVLMTQNAFVWNRNSKLRPQGEGQIRNWPQLKVLRRLLAANFKLRQVTSIYPDGDRGVLRLVNSRWIAGVLRKIIGQQAQYALYERLLIGRELIIVAERR